jgi:hypothetical protein
MFQATHHSEFSMVKSLAPPWGLCEAMAVVDMKGSKIAEVLFFFWWDKIMVFFFLCLYNVI